MLNQTSRKELVLKREVSKFSKKFLLSEREEQVFGLLVTRITHSEDIASRLNVSRNTVRNHFQNIFQKTKTASKTDLLAGFIDDIIAESE